MLNLLQKNLSKTKEEQYDDKKEGNPLIFIPTRTMKDVYLMQEIQMANLKIFKLVNFEGFLNLQILWLNGNKLSNVKGLHKNFRLKELYLHQNKIQDLDGDDFVKFKNLEVLTLNNNKLNNLQKTINVLSQLKRLKTLDLYNNPIESQPQYRRYSILKLKQIDYFDKLYITKQERKDLKKNQQNLKSQREYQIEFSVNEKNLIKSIRRRVNKQKMQQKENKIQQKVLSKTLPKRVDFLKSNQPQMKLEFYFKILNQMKVIQKVQKEQKQIELIDMLYQDCFKKGIEPVLKKDLIYEKLKVLDLNKSKLSLKLLIAELEYKPLQNINQKLEEIQIKVFQKGK